MSPLSVFTKALCFSFFRLVKSVFFPSSAGEDEKMCALSPKKCKTLNLYHRAERRAVMFSGSLFLSVMALKVRLCTTDGRALL